MFVYESFRKKINYIVDDLISSSSTLDFSQLDLGSKDLTFFLNGAKIEKFMR